MDDEPPDNGETAEFTLFVTVLSIELLINLYLFLKG